MFVDLLRWVQQLIDVYMNYLLGTLLVIFLASFAYRGLWFCFGVVSTRVIETAEEVHRNYSSWATRLFLVFAEGVYIVFKPADWYDQKIARRLPWITLALAIYYIGEGLLVYMALEQLIQMQLR